MGWAGCNGSSTQRPQGAGDGHTLTSAAGTQANPQNRPLKMQTCHGRFQREIQEEGLCRGQIQKQNLYMIKVTFLNIGEKSECLINGPETTR